MPISLNEMGKEITAEAEFDKLCEEKYQSLKEEILEAANYEEDRERSYSWNRKHRWIKYTPHNLAIALVCDELAEKGVSLPEETTNKIQRTIDAWTSLKQNTQRVWTEGPNAQKEQHLKTEAFVKKLEISKKAGGLVYNICCHLQNKTGANESTYVTSFSDLRNASFDRAYKGFFRAQLAYMLPETEWEHLIGIETEDEALEFINSKPLTGKKIAEVGGTHSSVFESLGATVVNPDTKKKEGISPEETKNLYSINLSNYERIYGKGEYDIVTSHMVLDEGTGFENVAGGDTDKAGLELHTVFSHMLKEGGLSIHVGHCAYSDVPYQLTIDPDLEKQHVLIFADGDEDNIRSNAIANSYPGRKIFIHGHCKFDDQVYREKIGLDPVLDTSRSRVDMRSSALLVENIAVFKKIGEATLMHEELLDIE